MSHKVFDNILSTIGDTPLVRLNWLSDIVGCTVYGKIETFNPGHSTKDRMALQMLEDAEKEGWIKPGGTIIECTSGNTGMGLAIAAAVKGYHCIFTTTDKQSKEKIDLLKAVGAEVIVCPTNVAPTDPKSYYSVAEKLNNEIPNSYWCNQYDNLSNRKAHYLTTGPEIWKQTEGKITHFAVGVGTGGTISGTGKYLKEQNPEIKVWGIDTYGSVFKKYHETGVFDEKEIYPYITEGIGEDILPKNVDFEVIDFFEKVSDKDGALMARSLARKEGILLGYSCGSAAAGLVQLKEKLSPDDLVVVLFHDHGSRYTGKIYNDNWMRERGFLEAPKSVGDLLNIRNDQNLISIDKDTLVSDAIEIMKAKDISQLPVIHNGEMLGAVTESKIIDYLLDAQNGKGTIVADIMTEAFPIVTLHTPISDLKKLISKQNPAVMSKDKTGAWHIVTQYDLIQSL